MKTDSNTLLHDHLPGRYRFVVGFAFGGIIASLLGLEFFPSSLVGLVCGAAWAYFNSRALVSS
jgi:hypothetical protein